MLAAASPRPASPLRASFPPCRAPPRRLRSLPAAACLPSLPALARLLLLLSSADLPSARPTVVDRVLLASAHRRAAPPVPPAADAHLLLHRAAPCIPEPADRRRRPLPGSLLAAANPALRRSGEPHGRLRPPRLRPPLLVPTHGGLTPLRLRGARCQGNDSLAYVDGPLEGTKGSSTSSAADDAGTSGSDVEEKTRAAMAAASTAGDVDDLRDALQRARKELEVARLNNTMFEGKAQRISESAIALKDRADGAQVEVLRFRRD